MINNHTTNKIARTLHGRFFDNAKKNPRRIAVIYSGEKITYGELSKYALKASNYLIQKGVRKGDKVAVILPRSVGQISALLGILAIGASYVPIDCTQPMSRIKKITDNVAPVTVLKNDDFLNEDVQPWTGNIILDFKVTAYIIYTSGSSGEPKGVEMTHQAVMNTINEVINLWNIGSDDSILSISSYAFDLSVFDIFGLLNVGGKIILVEEDYNRDPEEWSNLIKTFEITIWNSAPALLDMFLNLEKHNTFTSLRLALVSGDWIPLYLPNLWYLISSSKSEFISLGGATEAGIWSNYYPVSKVKKSWKSIPYGKPLPGQYYRIVNEDFNNCKVNISGELWIGGNSLAKGYINDSNLTKCKFINDKDGNRWYRTGDMGRYWSDGNIEFLGRMDNQVKIRGYRIELGDIESSLKEMIGISKAVVITKGDKYHKRLVAFYLGTVDEKEVQKHLSKQLPGYSVPSNIVKLDVLPLNENGKIDRKKLSAYTLPAEEVGLMHEDLNSSNTILNIWQNLLGHKIQNLSENLFNMGADSLIAAKFVEEFRAKTGITIHMKDIFDKPTVEQLIDWMNQQEKEYVNKFAEEGEI